MSKYEPLTQFLSAQRAQEVPMSFSEIERVLGFPLPEKASGIRAWWSNNPSNNVMTKAWLAAGFITERVDMGSRRLVFRKSNTTPAPMKTAVRPARSIGFLDRIRAQLGGTVTIPEGVDITAPTGEAWDAER
ncbi:MAG: hypothetical protein PSV23_07930 [Brevundimonas sp.]|uniref:DUF7662 domain-containing protein n=1 Tax=Brevundimonas sp. TaxID=1871086 RepID=UPI002488FD20|nr:hypothetical protein [Brevundimonas sp.]MDI1326716.1 hypothetical protein [Brevundimonas sp.]